MPTPDDKSRNERMALHPTSISVAATFLDILFGVLLGIIVLEFRPEHFIGKTVCECWLFSLLYAALLLKFFFHWYGIRSDSAVLGAFLNYSADVPKYLSGIFVAFTYFACIKLLVVWFENPVQHDWALRWFFGVLAGFKVIDTMSNLTLVRTLVKKLTTTLQTVQLFEAIRIIKRWYLWDQPAIVTGFLLSFPFLLQAARSPSMEARYRAAKAFLIVEGVVEAVLSWRRLKMWRRLAATVQKPH